MKRREFVFGLAALSVSPTAYAEAGEWQAKLLTGEFVDQTFTAGLQIKLAEGWKTYWRVPGESGIPPQITITGDNLKAAEIGFPLPSRLDQESGETIGYHNEMFLPLRLSLNDPARPLSIHLSAFFGVCRDICKPAKFETDFSFSANSPPSSDLVVIRDWQARVPVAANFVTSAKQEQRLLALDLTHPVDDIFVEGPDGLYFRKAGFHAGKATLRVDGLESDTALKGAKLRITAASGGKGLEQTVTVT